MQLLQLVLLQLQLCLQLGNPAKHHIQTLRTITWTVLQENTYNARVQQG